MKIPLVNIYILKKMAIKKWVLISGLVTIHLEPAMATGYDGSNWCNSLCHELSLVKDNKFS